MQKRDKVEADRQFLADAHARGTRATLGAFVRLSGPGWLQSAMTLGGGSLASSLYLGVLAGYSMLWLQPLAMILGIIMLGAIGYVTLSTGERPFRAINQHVNPVLGWGWALASLLANMVWCMPQFSLATGVIQQNLAPGLLGAQGPLDDTTAKLIIAGTILLITITITWAYDSGSWGIRLYELTLKTMVAAIVLCFFGVVFTLSRSEGGLDWPGIWRGFVPDFSKLFEPADTFNPLLAAIAENSGEAVCNFWAEKIVSDQRSIMISAAATAVGINMTFLFPYSLLARGWDRTFRGLSLFDLGTGMLIPFVLAVSCVTLVSATQFHTQPMAGFWEDESAAVPSVAPSPRAATEFNGLLDARLKFEYPHIDEIELAEQRANLDLNERRLAATLVSRDAIDLAKALEPLTGSIVANIVFGVGVLGMTLSTITLLMLISGFVICEMLGLPPGGWPHRLGCLAASVGALGPFFWNKASFYLAVPTSVFGMMLLPIAYFTFFLLMNQSSLLGDDMPRGFKRLTWNLAMACASTVAGLASLWILWDRGGPIGLAGFVGFLGLALSVQWVRRQRGT